jgi:hypothetical protein
MTNLGRIDMRRKIPLAFLLTIVAVPGAGAHDKLDALLDSWIGKTAEEVVDVWGYGKTEEPAEADFEYLYSTSSQPFRFNAAGITAASVNRACSVSFEFVRLEVVRYRVRTPGSAKESQCWRAFRRNEPPN